LRVRLDTPAAQSARNPLPENTAKGGDSVTGGKIWHDIEVLFAGYADVKI
jgi:hypothetical protein